MRFYQSELIGSSKDDTWTTPKAFFEELSKEFNFTLDAAALSNSALCEEWYGPDHPDENKRDALTADWLKDSNGGVVWLNPPYGNKVTRKWLEKAQSEASRGATVMCLVPSRTGALWFHDLCFPHQIRFIKRRLNFGDGKNPAPFDSALVLMKDKPNPGYF